MAHPVGHRSILQWATEQFGLKKSYLHDELFIPWHCQKACRNLNLFCLFVCLFDWESLQTLRGMASWRVFFFCFFFCLEITRLRPEKPFEFWQRPFFFFLEITCFRPKKPFQSNWRLMKIWVKFVYWCFKLPKKPPLSKILATLLLKIVENCNWAILWE